MQFNHSSGFSLGTAQFGSKYGINNKIGKLKIIEIKKIIKFDSIKTLSK